MKKRLILLFLCLGLSACGLDEERECRYANRTTIVEEGTPKVVNICLEYKDGTP